MRIQIICLVSCFLLPNDFIQVNANYHKRPNLLITKSRNNLGNKHHKYFKVNHSGRSKYFNNALNNHIQRRMPLKLGELILGAPRRPEDLPSASPILPGHTLVRPSRGMLKSAMKYPLRDAENALVYGNLDNLGITWDNTPNRVLYTDFRRSNAEFLTKLWNSIRTSNIYERFRPVIIMELDPAELITMKNKLELKQFLIKISEKENDASEDLDDLEPLSNIDRSAPDFRRKSKKGSKSKYRKRSKYYKKEKKNDTSTEDSDTTSSSSSYERNPGNPYTLYKDKYKQNWMWNHKLDGTHMNINPYAPALNQLGPTGPELFLARKWWYFNQDDYKPMGKK